MRGGVGVGMVMLGWICFMMALARGQLASLCLPVVGFGGTVQVISCPGVVVTLQLTLGKVNVDDLVDGFRVVVWLIGSLRSVVGLSRLLLSVSLHLGNLSLEELVAGAFM